MLKQGPGLAAPSAHLLGAQSRPGDSPGKGLGTDRLSQGHCSLGASLLVTHNFQFQSVFSLDLDGATLLEVHTSEELNSHLRLWERGRCSFCSTSGGTVEGTDVPGVWEGRCKCFWGWTSAWTR